MSVHTTNASDVVHASTMQYTHLVEPNGSRLLTEALTAEVEAVLADETSLVCAEAAVWCSVSTPTYRTMSNSA